MTREECRANLWQQLHSQLLLSIRLFNNFADMAPLCLDCVDLGSIIAYSAADQQSMA